METHKDQQYLDVPKPKIYNGYTFLEVNYTDAVTLAHIIMTYRDDFNSGNIRCLVIHGNARTNTPIDLSALCYVPDLRAIQFDQLAGYDTLDLGHLEQCSKLEEFVILATSSDKGTLEHIDLLPLSKCINLKEIQITSQTMLERVDLTPLSNCSLQSVIIADLPVGELDISPILKKSLQTIDLSANKINSISIPHVHGMKLKEISLDRNQLIRVDLSFLDTRNLETLRLTSNKISSIDISFLEHASNIRNIFLGENKLTKIDLSVLSGKTLLNTVELYGNPIASLDVSPLLSCDNLESIMVNKSVSLVPTEAVEILNRQLN